MAPAEALRLGAAQYKTSLWLYSTCPSSPLFHPRRLRLNQAQVPTTRDATQSQRLFYATVEHT